MPLGFDMNDVTPKGRSGKPTPLEDISLWKDSVYAAQMSVSKKGPRTYFYGDYSALLEIADDTYDVMSAAAIDTEKKFSREMFRYYVSVLLWARILDLKTQQSLVLTQTEKDLREVFQSLEFAVPYPIYQYLMSVGTVKRMGGNLLYPNFPNYPDQINAGRGGYWTVGPITVATLPEYLAFPSLGVLSEALCAQTTVPFTGAYVSNVSPPAPAAATQNLPGFVIALKPRPEVLSSLVASGVTPATFPESVPKTGFNTNIVTRVSNSLMTTRVYKVVTIKFIGLASSGLAAQLIRQERDQTAAPGKFIHGFFVGRSSEAYTPTEFGISATYQLMIRRFDGQGADPILAWSPIDFGGVAPPGWNAAAANARFSLNPPEVMLDIWSSVYINVEAKRKTVMRQLSSLKEK